MAYTFNLVGVSPLLEFFQHEQAQSPEQFPQLPAYVGVSNCLLDVVLNSVEEVVTQRHWDLDEAVDSVIQYWVHNKETVEHWRDRLQDAGQHQLLIGRVANLRSLQSEFNRLLGQ